MESFFLFLLALELLDEGRDKLVVVGTVNRELFWLFDTCRSAMPERAEATVPALLTPLLLSTLLGEHALNTHSVSGPDDE